MSQPGKPGIKKSGLIKTSFSGIGLAAPSFSDLDPNKILEVLKQRPIEDPRVADAMTKQGEMMLDQFISHPQELAPGVDMQVVTDAAK